MPLRRVHRPAEPSAGAPALRALEEALDGARGVDAVGGPRGHEHDHGLTGSKDATSCNNSALLCGHVCHVIAKYWQPFFFEKGLGGKELGGRGLP